MLNVSAVARRYAVLLLPVLLAGCGVSTKKLDEAEARMKVLAEQGAPDSALFDARILLADTRGLLKAGNTMQAAPKADSLFAAVDAAEKWYTEALANARTELAAVKTTIGESKATLTGLHLRAADSMLAKAEVIEQKGFLLQAREELAKLENRLQDLHEQQKKALSLQPKVIGTWREVTNPDGVGTTSVLKSTFAFKKDGSAEASEEKKGQSNETTKEDWKFLSWGTWQIKGDTIVMHVTREKCERQNFEFLKSKDGKQYWEKKQEPTYDTTYTDNKKDKHITWKDLTTDFKKQ